MIKEEMIVLKGGIYYLETQGFGAGLSEYRFDFWIFGRVGWSYSIR